MRWDRTLGFRQGTLKKSATLSGVGVHTGALASMTLSPAPAEAGIAFIRTDGGQRDVIRADWRNVAATDYCTVLAHGGRSVATVEHLMAAFRALGIDNAIVEVDGPELPVMDGSARDFVEAIDRAGVVSQPASRRFLRVMKPVRVEQGSSRAEFLPHHVPRVEIEIDFASPLVGRRTFAADVTPSRFRRDLAGARTFGFLADVERLRANGLAKGASLANAIVVGEDRVVNPEGLRWPDEFVRHKVLDAIGDLALAGAPILGCYRSYRGGHALNVGMLKALFAEPGALSVVEADVEVEGGYAGAAVAAAAMAPEVS